MFDIPFLSSLYPKKPAAHTQSVTDAAVAHQIRRPLTKIALTLRGADLEPGQPPTNHCTGSLPITRLPPH